MPERSDPKRAASTRSVHEQREREQALRPSRCHGHRQPSILTWHSSIRRHSWRHPTVSNPDTEPEATSESVSFRNPNPAQEQFMDGQPTPSLNCQRPGYVRTFSRSNALHSQYDAETAPNMAYIERTASMASQEASRRLRAVNRARESSDKEEATELERTASNSLRPAETDIAHSAPVESWPAFPQYHVLHATQDSVDDQESVEMGELTQRRGISRAAFFSDAYDQSERDDQRSMLQILFAGSEPTEPLEVSMAWENGRLCHHDRDTHAIGRDGPRRTVQTNEPSPEYISRNTSTKVTVDEVEEEETELFSRNESVARDHAHGQVDYFGDSIPAEEPPNPPFLPRNSFRSDSTTPEVGLARAIRLFPTNPDPPSRCNTIGATVDDDRVTPPLPIRLPSYHRREPVQPAITSYPRPLEQQTYNSQTLTRIGTERQRQLAPDAPQLRKPRSFFDLWSRCRGRHAESVSNDTSEESMTSLCHDIAPTHWALYFIQAIFWIALAAYFFWRVANLGNTVPFECYELRTQLLHLGENMTLVVGNATVPLSLWNTTAIWNTSVEIPINRTNKPHTPSSIRIPKAFHAELTAHCILQPINPAVVLASHLDVLIVMALLSCGIATMLQAVVLQQLKRWMAKSGPDATRTLVWRIGVHVGAVGVASVGVVGVAWAMKDGRAV